MHCVTVSQADRQDKQSDLTMHAPRATCSTCTRFNNDPAYVERAIPGLTSMGSAWASVRGNDGICSVHDRYLSPTAGCNQHESRDQPRHELRRIDRR